MAINYTSSGGVFTIVGKLIGRINSYFALGATTLPADLVTLINAIAAGEFGDLLAGINGNYTSAINSIVSLRSALAALATGRMLESDLTGSLELTTVNIQSVMAALLAQMVTDTQTVLQSNVTVGSVTPAAGNVGNGTILVSPILDGVTAPAKFAVAQPGYNGLTSQLPIAETMLITCVNDSYSGNVQPGNEAFQITGPIGQTNVWGVGTEGTGAGPTFNTAQASSLLSNGSFTTFSGTVPTSWTLTGPTADCAQDVTTAVLGSSSVKLTGDSTTNPLVLSQAINRSSLTPMKRYLVCGYYKASATAAGSTLTVAFSGTGYSPAGSEQFQVSGAAWATTWTFFSFWINLPKTLPSPWTLNITITGPLPTGTSLWFDTFGVVQAQFENGLGFAATTGGTAFVKGDSFSVAIGNDNAGAFQLFGRRNWGVQFPSSASPTIPNSLAT
jgi:hypothetical protein